MAAVVRLLPSIRPQMASLTSPLLIFQPALCGKPRETKIGEEERRLTLDVLSAETSHQHGARLTTEPDVYNKTQLAPILRHQTTAD
ncbi:hypothetical protein NQZ68_002995 [Dissostichus eleginoides]|nr:hypothetical protein NQZ68_002995 [Dissostichus eleginoides]